MPSLASLKPKLGEAHLGRSMLAVSLAAIGLLGAGCGGASKAPSVASLGTTPSAAAGRAPAAGAQGAKRSRAALASCLTDHGYSTYVGSAGGAGAQALDPVGVIVPGDIDPNSPQFQRALQACRKFLPDRAASLSPAERAADAKAMVAFAICMRKNGVPSFPDPNGQGMFPFDGLHAIDPTSPLVEGAFKTCEGLEPKLGPRLSLP
jgi:hypothetical protein